MRAQSTMQAAGRDVRLDFFRGLAMMIIIVAHSPGNPWVHWIPARFGFSSAAEMFVFCSGFASAFAFGTVFLRRGFPAGLTRVVRRIGQLYCAQVLLFAAMVAITLAAARLFGEAKYIDLLGIGLLLHDPATALLGFATLRFLPNLFDMLPMYIVILAMIPAAMMLAAIDARLALGVSFALWLVVQVTGLNLPARPDGSLGWYFDPFAWQFLFFLGFGFAAGWIPAPRLRDRRLVAVAAAIVLASVPLTFWGFNQTWPVLDTWRQALAGDGLPTFLGPARIVHFLALAYLVLSFVDPRRDRLATAPWAKPMLLIGRQTLPVFLASIVIGWIMGIAFDRLGDGWSVAVAVNAAGLGTAILVAASARWFKRQPWRRPATESGRLVSAGASPGQSRLVPAE